MGVVDLLNDRDVTGPPPKVRFGRATFSFYFIKLLLICLGCLLTSVIWPHPLVVTDVERVEDVADVPAECLEVLVPVRLVPARRRGRRRGRRPVPAATRAVGRLVGLLSVSLLLEQLVTNPVAWDNFLLRTTYFVRVQEAVPLNRAPSVGVLGG